MLHSGVSSADLDSPAAILGLRLLSLAVFALRAFHDYPLNVWGSLTENRWTFCADYVGLKVAVGDVPTML